MKHSDDFMRRKLLSRSRVDTDSPLVNGKHCLLWQRGMNTQGYGMLWNGESNVLAARESLRLLGGKRRIRNALHHCDNPGCIEPAHLYSGTHRDNTRDMLKRGRGVRGAGHRKAKLTETQARYILQHKQRMARHTVRELSAELGVSISLVRGVLAGRNWGWLQQKR